MSALSRLTVIIPFGPDENEPSALIADLAALPKSAEILVVGTTAQPPYIFPKHYRWIQSERGRAVQMNVGARSALGEYLLFLHADSRVPTRAFRAIEISLATAPLALHFSNMRFAHDGP